VKLSRQIRKYIETIVKEALDTFEKVSNVARQNLRVPPKPASSAFASINTLTSAAAVRQYDEISRASREASEILGREPAVARVIARGDDGSLRTIGPARYRLSISLRATELPWGGLLPSRSVAASLFHQAGRRTRW
jgi:hypothetical protein